MPSVIFTEKYRKEEYLRSEFMTDNQYSKVISLGDFHYIHWEEPIIIVEEIKEVIKNLI
ncbi:hydrolase [Oenococcus oeni IOEB_0501]|nr:hydrolase [Oenococcus oeni IOEB_0501]